MCTDQVYKVKLIGFSRASKTAELSDFKIPLSCGYTAPEIFLDCPLDQSVDIWSLGLSLLNDHFDFKDWFCMEFELLKENLLDFSRRQNRSLKVYEIRAIAKQMLTALRVFKQLGISHADLKPENIMLVNHEKQPFGLKLIDFGAACETEQLPDEYIIQTLGYRAPEVILGLQPDESIDMWSLGCILAELFLNYPLFPTQNEYDNLRVIMKLFGEPNKKQLEDGSLRAHPAYDDITCLDDLFFSHKTRNSAENTDLKAFLDLVKKMLTVDPNERIRPADAVNHPFITMEHLNNTSVQSYVRKAHKIMKHVQKRPPGIYPSEGERENTLCPGSSKMPIDPITLDGSLLKIECDDSTSGSKFNPEELVKIYYDEQRRKMGTGRENRSPVLQTQTKTGTKPTGERKNTPHPKTSKIPSNHVDELLSEEATFGLKSSKRASSIGTECFVVRNQPPVKVIENQFDDADIKPKDNKHLELMPVDKFMTGAVEYAKTKAKAILQTRRIATLRGKGKKLFLSCLDFSTLIYPLKQAPLHFQ
uniref:Protein kinase domain-containing protein n=1 Tax=Nothobranchius furzeri TaxID=105023 RepID=A0A8C6L6B0_NOTFU